MKPILLGDAIIESLGVDEDGRVKAEILAPDRESAEKAARVLIRQEKILKEAFGIGPPVVESKL